MLGGIAFADGGWGGWGASSSSGGNGGSATNNCVNVGIPILSGIGLLGGEGAASAASCSASANGG